MSTYLRVWPVTNIDVRFSALIAQADLDLWDALIDEGLRAAGDPVWQLADKFDLPGAVDGIALTVRVPVVAVADELGPTTRLQRVEAVAHLTDLGLSAAEIALRLGVTSRQVVRDRASRWETSDALGLWKNDGTVVA